MTAPGEGAQWVQPPKKPGASRAPIVVLGLILALALGGMAMNATQRPAAGPRNYASEFGGNPSVYAEIARETSCAALQASFDQAAANNDAAEPGTAAHRASLGFMTASLDRMTTLGCS